MTAFTNHETDSHGFPLCECEACREKSKIRNAQEISKLFGRIFGGPDIDKLRAIENDEDLDVFPQQAGSQS